MSSILFDRRVVVTVDDLKFSSDPSTTGVHQPGFHITFNVERDLSGKCNKGEATIDNLSVTSQGRITSKKKPKFTIEAGYRETFGSIFTGEAVEISTVKNAVGFTTTIRAQDGYDAGRSRISKALPPNSKPQNVIEAIVKAMTGVDSKTVMERVKKGDFNGLITAFKSGVSLSGTAKDELNKIASACGFRWSIEDGQLKILNPGDISDPGISVVLEARTGLIDSPYRVRDRNRPDAFIIRARSLVQPLLVPGRGIQLVSEQISGTFRAEKVGHTGDSHQGDFYSDVEAVQP